MVEQETSRCSSDMQRACKLSLSTFRVKTEPTENQQCSNFDELLESAWASRGCGTLAGLGLRDPHTCMGCISRSPTRLPRKREEQTCLKGHRAFCTTQAALESSPSVGAISSGPALWCLPVTPSGLREAENHLSRPRPRAHAR